MAGKFENDSPIVQFSFVSFQPISYPAILQYTFVWKMVFPNEDARICNFLTSEIWRENLKMIRQLFNSLSFHSKRFSYLQFFDEIWRENLKIIRQFSFIPFQPITYKLSCNFIIHVLKDHFPNESSRICNFLTKYGGKIWKLFANCSILFRSIPAILQFYNTGSFERSFS